MRDRETSYGEYRYSKTNTWKTETYTNAVDLARKVQALNDHGICYELESIQVNGVEVAELRWDRDSAKILHGRLCDRRGDIWQKIDELSLLIGGDEDENYSSKRDV